MTTYNFYPPYINFDVKYCAKRSVCSQNSISRFTVESDWIRTIKLCDDRWNLFSSPHEVSYELWCSGCKSRACHRWWKRVDVHDIKNYSMNSKDDVQRYCRNAINTLLPFYQVEKSSNCSVTRGAIFHWKKQEDIALMKDKSLGVHWEPSSWGLCSHGERRPTSIITSLN